MASPSLFFAFGFLGHLLGKAVQGLNLAAVRKLLQRKIELHAVCLGSAGHAAPQEDHHAACIGRLQLAYVLAGLPLVAEECPIVCLQGYSLSLILIFAPIV